MQIMQINLFFHRHHAQGYLVKTVQSAFPITVKTNTNVIVFPATQEDTVKQVYKYIHPFFQETPEKTSTTRK